MSLLLFSIPQNSLLDPALRAAARVPVCCVLVAGLAGCSSAGSTSTTEDAVDVPSPNDDALDLAAAYSEERAGDALLVWRDGAVVLEDDPNGYAANRPHMLASGTKTFTGAMALAAAEDGLLTLDERVAETLPEWQADAQKSTVTIRQLLQLTSGLETRIGRAPTYQAAVETPLVHAPGESFRYGPVAFQVFGAVLERKLDGEAPDAYLARRILEPIGAEVASWAGPGGDANLGAGARMTARNWLRFGRLLLQDGRWEGEPVIASGVLAPLSRPTAVGPGYGLSVWLNAPVDPDAAFFDHTPPDVAANSPDGMIYADGPEDLFMAAGLHNQRLYVIPSREMVVVRFGRRDRDWDDAEFLARLLDGRAYDAPARQQAALDPEERVAFLTRIQMSRLDAALALTDAQKDSIRPVVERRAEGLLEIRQMREENAPLRRRDKRLLFRRLRRLQASTDDAITQRLTAEQVDAYRAFRAEQRERLRQRR